MSHNNAKALPHSQVQLVEEISRLINQRTGIQLGAKQVSMVESRLKRRTYELGLARIEEYDSYFHENRDSEVEALVSLLTTHHTFFFREFVQFEFLEQKLPELVARARTRGSKTLEIYSAACSRGQEVYSLAMHLDYHLKEIAPDFDFHIFGSDVDPQSIEIAKNGVYRREDIKGTPLNYLGSHWARGTGEISEFVKAKKSLRNKVSFSVVNLIDHKGTEGKSFDAIFCRNVFIYFTLGQVKSITEGLISKLHPGGLLFVGVSESLHSSGLPIHAVGSSVYSTKALAPASAPVVSALLPPVAPTPVFVMPNPLRVVCIDDSASILTLMKKILTKEHGFEVVGTAANGLEAQEVVKKQKPDALTLDIHMPIKTGIEFLEDTKGKDRPPTVMVTSVSREDAALAWKTLSLGASDYVEKPALNNLEQRADEIRAKLRSAYRSRQKPAPKKLDKEFSRDAIIPRPTDCGCLLVFGLGEFDACAKVVKELGPLNLKVWLTVEGADAMLPSIAERISAESRQKVTMEDGVFQLLPFRAACEALSKKPQKSVMVFGEIAKHGAEQVLSLIGAQLLLADLGAGKGTAALAEVASDVLPASSFTYLAQQFFADAQKVKG